MIDRVGLKKWWDTFVGEDGFTEVRILGKFQYSGYFKSFDNLCKQLEPYTEMDDEQIYFVLNQIDDSVYGRPQCEKFLKSVKVSTNDGDIVRRRFLMIDCDAIRKSSTNSSESEYQAAIQKARDIFRFLREKGFFDPIVCTSGNGAHLQIPVDLPADEDTTEVIKRFYKYLGLQFTDNQVDIDQKVYNLARLCKTYYTVAKKGANLPSRPWRKAEILYIPKELVPTPIEKIKEIADLLPPEEPKPTPTRRQQYNGGQFDLRSWLDEYGIEYKVESNGSGTKYVLRHCPWEDTHSSIKEYESALFQDAAGKITFNCFHAHCHDKQWVDFRLYYQPDAYNRPAYQPQYQPRLYVPQKPKYEIKEVLPELGGKWLSLSDIKKVDIMSIERFKTGFDELDRNIMGLAIGEVTLLSGGNASGKSSWLNTLLLNVINQGVGAALWSGELPSPILKSWIQMVAAGKHNLRQSQYGQGRYYVPDNVAQRIDEWTNGKLFIYNNDYGCEWTQIFHDMNELLKANVKMFVLDNLFSMGIDSFDGDKNNKQKELILQIKDFAKKQSVHIILVAHPRKTVSFLRKADISGTADLTNAVDNVFICHRVNNDFLRTGAEYLGQARINQMQGFGNVIEVCKNRMFGIVDLLVGMHYEIETRRFKNTEYEDIHYGWEQEPTQQTIDYSEPQPQQEQRVQEYDPFGQPLEGDAPF